MDGHDKLLYIPNKRQKADTTDTMTLLESKDYSHFIFCADVVKCVEVIDDERKGR